MKKGVLIFICILNINFAWGQGAFKFKNKEKKSKISFLLENNLIIIPLKINGLMMSFLVDTGVEETILFSINSDKELKLYNPESIKLRGLGSLDDIEGLKSSGNTIEVGNLKSDDETVIVVLDEDFNFSSSLGIPVNGIIGYKFFRDHTVKIDYTSKKIIVFSDESSKKIKFKKYIEIPITLEQNKPYLNADLSILNINNKAKLLIDTGSSDALWVFSDQNKSWKVPEKNFDDFLGRGFSGEIYGKKAIAELLKIKDYQFKNTLAAFPDSLSLKQSFYRSSRNGSIGAEICRRFTIIFDYKNQKMYLKQNSHFHEPFSYNKSGIDLQHSGVRIVEQIAPQISSVNGGVKMNFGDGDKNVKYLFELKPNYEVVAVRKNSPADLAGLQKGDILLAINNVQSYRYKLHELMEILKSEDGKLIKIEIQRGKITKEMSFRLKDLL
jgi:hypothetical protein